MTGGSAVPSQEVFGSGLTGIYIYINAIGFAIPKLTMGVIKHAKGHWWFMSLVCFAIT